MESNSVLTAAAHGIAFLFGLLLLIAPFTPQGRVAPHWIRVALWLCGSIAIVWSMIGLTLFFRSDSLSAPLAFTLRKVKTVVGGMAIGILVLLFASGQFVESFSRSKHNAGR